MIVHHNSSTLFYSKEGNGEKVLLLFHGFGQDHTAFKPLIGSLTGEYTCYAFDLYFHGKSQWAHGDAPLEKHEWKEILSAFLAENQIEKFSVLGFSLGGKFALAAVELFPERIDRLFLVAADGVRVSFWYRLATYPVLTRRLFKSMILHPDRFFSIGGFFKNIGLLDKGVMRFAESQMSTVEKRSRVYYAWVVFRHLSFDMNIIAQLINRFEIQTLILVGEYDKVVPPKKMTRLVTRLKHYKLEIAEAGHNHLLTSETLKSLLVSVMQNDTPR